MKFRVQSSKFRVIWILIFSFAACSLQPAARIFAQDSDRLVALTKQLMDAESDEELYASLEGLKQLYFSENKYTEFVGFLRSLEAKKKNLEPLVNYYIAVTRYTQLKALEARQEWDEYFASGNAYREELVGSAEKAVGATTSENLLNSYARLLLWLFHKDQQDAFAEQSLEDLMTSITEYSRSSNYAEPLKEIADQLSSHEEKGKARQLYRIYTEKLAASSVNDEELKNISANFFNEGNLELAESVYDLYLERIYKTDPKENLIPVLIGLAKEFSYKDEGVCDPFYAEKLFAKIEELAGKEAFNEELIYLRAFNLEKSKEYAKAKEEFLLLVGTFPETSHSDEALFKAGMISAYVLRDRQGAKANFQRLAEKEGTPSPRGICALYQLGLLSQWEDDFEAAKTYYNKLIELAGADFPQNSVLTAERLKEIEQSQPIEYNLKTFLDASFKEEYARLDMTKINLKSHPYRAGKDEDVLVDSSVYAGETGCMQVELEYLWSGQLGEVVPSTGEAQFNTSYPGAGTKEINLVVVSPSGIIDRSIDLVDVD